VDLESGKLSGVKSHAYHIFIETLPRNDRRELATTWENYWFALDGSYRNGQGVVVHDFWVSIFFMHDFFSSLL
jgi:hypothetical protein